MKWVQRQLTLPIIIGFSLTGVSIAFIYLLYKKDKENGNSKKGEIETGRFHVVEYTVPRKFVPAVIGRGGSTIKDVQSKTGTRINFKEDNIEKPDRICLIKGSHEGIHLAQQMIRSIIENQPIIETYEMYIPQTSGSKIIGRGGEVIRQIQTSSSAKIIVENSYQPYDSNAEKRVIIKGTAEQIANALSQIEDKVREDKEARLKLEASSASRLPRGKLSPRNTAANNTEPAQSTESLSVQMVDGSMEVYVSAIESPSQFWIQVVGPGTTALDNLVSDMTAYYNEEENREIHTLKNVTVGKIVAARFSFDEQWYRAEVISTSDYDYCEVYFMDYGDHEMVRLNSVFELRTDFLSLRLQAIECSLANVKPRENEWSTEACDKFGELTWLAQWKVLVAKVKGYKERSLSYGISRREGLPIPCVDLFDKNDEKDINIGQELINEGFAEPEEVFSSTASSTLSLSTRSQDIPNISTPASVSPITKRALSPETSTSTPTKSNAGLNIPGSTKTEPNIDVIDLTTPIKPVSQIEEVDLVTPVKNETSRFIDNERRVHRENGSGDYLQNGSSSQYKKSQNNSYKIHESSGIAPAGYESDISRDSDEFELG